MIILPSLARRVSRFFGDRHAATAIEYALIAGLIAVVIIGALTTVGSTVRNTHQGVANEIGRAGTGG